MKLTDDLRIPDWQVWQAIFGCLEDPDEWDQDDIALHTIDDKEVQTSLAELSEWMMERVDKWVAFVDPRTGYLYSADDYLVVANDGTNPVKDQGDPTKKVKLGVRLIKRMRRRGIEGVCINVPGGEPIRIDWAPFLTLSNLVSVLKRRNPMNRWRFPPSIKKHSRSIWGNESAPRLKTFDLSPKTVRKVPISRTRRMSSVVGPIGKESTSPSSSSSISSSRSVLVIRSVIPIRYSDSVDPRIATRFPIPARLIWLESSTSIRTLLVSTADTLPSRSDSANCSAVSVIASRPPVRE